LRQPGRRSGRAFFFYWVVTLGFYWPRLRELDEHIIGDGGDGLAFLWNIWWLKQSLLQGHNPYFTDMAFAPDGTPLIWHSLAVLPMSVIGLLDRWLPLVIAHNLVVMTAFPLAGLGAYLLCRHVTRDSVASFVGGLVFMLSPFLASKTLGHMNLLWGGLLAYFALALLAATEPGSSNRWGPRLGLALTSLAIVLSNMHTAIFAANVTFWTFLWRGRRSRRWRETTRDFARALWPTALATAPWAAIVVSYAWLYDWLPHTSSSAWFCPEPRSYLFPYTPTSLHSQWLRDQIDFWEMAGQIELAVYLGVLVFPLCVAGLVLRRREPLARWAALLLVAYLVLSLGPVLQHAREPIYIGPIKLYLPFALWRKLPLLGGIYQSGRYLLIVYAMMAIGLACGLAAMRERLAPWPRRIVVAAVAALVCLDFAFTPVLSELPEVPQLADAGAVLDPRMGSAHTMYYQTIHGRPLVGGYLARRPRHAVARYESTPGIAWLFARDPDPDIDLETLLTGLHDYGVGVLLLAPDDPRSDTLARLGFRRSWQNQREVVWLLP
jgi:hypothetical protein